MSIIVRSYIHLHNVRNVLGLDQQRRKGTNHKLSTPKDRKSIFEKYRTWVRGIGQCCSRVCEN